MLKPLMRRLHNITCKNNSGANNASVNSRAFEQLTKAKKTRGFSNLDQSRDDSFGKLIKELSKE